MSTKHACPVPVACTSKDERLRFRRDYTYAYRFGHGVPSMEWWASRIVATGTVAGWDLLTAGDIAYVRPHGQAVYGLRHHGCSDSGAVLMGNDAAGIVLSMCAVAWESAAATPDCRLPALLAGLEALARRHLERDRISALVFPLERLAAL